MKPFCVLTFCFFLFTSYLCAAENEIFEKIVVKKSAFTRSLASITSDSLTSLTTNCALDALRLSLINLQARSPLEAIQQDFSFRANNFQGVRLLLNERQINDSQTGHHDSDLPFTKEDIEEIAIVSSVFPLGFGPQAIAGAINFNTKKTEERKAILELSAGLNNYGRRLLSISEKKENLGLRLSVENSDSSGFREDTDFKKFTSCFGFFMTCLWVILLWILVIRKKNLALMIFILPA